MRIVLCVSSFLIFFLSCKNKQNVFLPTTAYYKIDKHGFLQITKTNDSINGIFFWINRKDSSLINGSIHDSVMLFKTYVNNVDENFNYKGLVRNDGKIMLDRQDEDSLFSPDNFIAIPVSEADFRLAIKETLTPIKLQILSKDTSIGDFIFSMKIRDWNPETYSGTTSMTIKEKNSNKIIQTITSDKYQNNENLFFGYADFNFDGINDLYFSTGFEGSYGTESFDYYLFDLKKKKFIFNEQLTRIASGMGIERDSIKKRILSFEKSGCCWHRESAFVFDGDSLVEIKKMTIDEEENVEIENYKNGKWIKTHLKIKDLKKQFGDDVWKGFNIKE